MRTNNDLKTLLRQAFGNIITRHERHEAIVFIELLNRKMRDLRVLEDPEIKPLFVAVVLLAHGGDREAPGRLLTNAVSYL